MVELFEKMIKLYLKSYLNERRIDVNSILAYLDQLNNN
jgi:hypothetical protein